MDKFSEIIASQTPVLVDFFASWCGPCHAMEPVLQQLKQELGDQVRIVKVDVDKNPEAAGSYKVRSIPTLVLFRNSEVKWRQSGAMSLQDLKLQVARHF